MDLIAASGGRICAHLHVPLQSGSDQVLRAMGRTYSSAEYLQRLLAARAKMPALALSTDVIVGFPGESERDFEQTLQVCAQAGFSRIHVFRYSRRPGTAAASLLARVADQTMNDRSRRLHDLAAELALADAQSNYHAGDYLPKNYNALGQVAQIADQASAGVVINRVI